MVSENIFEEVTFHLKADHGKVFILQNGDPSIGNRENIQCKILRQ